MKHSSRIWLLFYHSSFYVFLFFCVGRAVWFLINKNDTNSMQQRTYDAGKAVHIVFVASRLHIVFVASRLAESACPLIDVAAIAWGDWSASVPRSELPFPMLWSRPPSGCCRGFPSYTSAWSAHSSARRRRISFGRTTSRPVTRHTRPCSSRRRPGDTALPSRMMCTCKQVPQIRFISKEKIINHSSRFFLC